MEKITIYAVSATSLNDGHRLNFGYYISLDNAELARDDYPGEMNSEIHEIDAIRLDDGSVVEMPRKIVELSDDKQRILNKLSTEERRILGV